MFIKSILLFVTVASSGIMTAQSQSKTTAVKTTNDTITTKSGLRYVITKKNPKGTKAAKGDRVEAHYTGTLTDGKKFDSSRDGGAPFGFTVGQGEVIAGWDEGFALLREGEVATLIIPASLGYGSQDMGSIPANSTLIFDVEVIHVHKKHLPYSGKGKDTVTLKNGMKYIVIAKGSATKGSSNDTMASVYYAGYLVDGTRFDGNFESCSPLVLSIKEKRIIEGWKQMLPLMTKGMKVRVIIPAYLAYGQRGYPGVIPPNATLVFDMYLSDLNSNAN